MVVIHCGFNTVHEKKITFATLGPNIYLFLLIKTPARFYLNGNVCVAKPNDILLYKKGTRQYYEMIGDTYIDDFIFFECSNEEDEKFLSQLPLKYNQLLNLPNPLSLMNIAQNICTEHTHYHAFHDESIDHLMKYFLIKLNEAMNPEYSELLDHKLMERFNSLRLLFYSQPEKRWTISDMANYVQLSPSYLQKIYKQIFHVSCVSDLITSRISYARELLTTTNLSVTEIAAKCGYDSYTYFSRYFKEKCGISPLQYRKKYHI